MRTMLLSFLAVGHSSERRIDLLTTHHDIRKQPTALSVRAEPFSASFSLEYNYCCSVCFLLKCFAWSKHLVAQEIVVNEKTEQGKQACSSFKGSSYLLSSHWRINTVDYSEANACSYRKQTHNQNASIKNMFKYSLPQVVHIRWTAIPIIHNLPGKAVVDNIPEYMGKVCKRKWGLNKKNKSGKMKCSGWDKG